MMIRRINVITVHAVVINDSVYINPEDLKDWNSLTGQERILPVRRRGERKNTMTESHLTTI
ncbi:hypothetical protein V6721_04540 [Cutibacterium acnes]|uniref:hypothetical protein n=1 Tax=Cutibacterium acnes TaxID=1747 RepID=UPI002FEF1353